MNFVSDFDILLFTETWNSKHSKPNINGYDYFDCPRPKCSKKAKRNSGGVIIYYKEKYRNNLELVDVNYKGIIWLKLKSNFICSDNDTFICLTYVPPEDSSLYKNVNSSLFEFDFFEQLSNDYRRYSDRGDVYLTGDYNSRTGELPDFIPDINLNRYVDMPDDDIETRISNCPLRKNQDKHVNSFGHKLLSFCKENNVLIANGRIEQGNCTFNSLFRNKPIASTVDYLITNNNIKYLFDDATEKLIIWAILIRKNYLPVKLI